MRRIIVIGCCGAGKSTLARELGTRLALPVHHLDRLFWLPDWQECDHEEFVRDQKRILEGPAWIIDGNYGSTMRLRLNACDTVLYLDFPLRTCLWGVLKRIYSRKPRPDMADGCAERFDWEFLRYVIGFRRHHRPHTEKLLRTAYSGTVHRFRSRRDLRKFLSAL